jgi:hypothetical protein
VQFSLQAASPETSGYTVVCNTREAGTTDVSLLSKQIIVSIAVVAVSVFPHKKIVLSAIFRPGVHGLIPPAARR